MPDNDLMTDKKKLGELWHERIKKSYTFEKEWYSTAEEAAKIFANEDIVTQQQGHNPNRTYFNIVHSNVETIVPAIYNSTPKPDIRPKGAGVPKPGEVTTPSTQICHMFEAAISDQIDNNALDEEIELMAQGAFLAGRGVIRVRFDAEVEEVIETDTDTGEEYVIDQKPVNERLEFEDVAWHDFRIGPAQRWKNVPWVAFKTYVSKETLADLTDKDTDEYDGITGGWEDPNVQETDDTKQREKDSVVLWEIWCKTTRTVKFLREADSIIISSKDDPLGLSGFFPMPKPMTPIRLNGSMKPICPYGIYRELASELNILTERIKVITSGMKVAGGYSGDGQVAQAIAEMNDNELVAIPNVEEPDLGKAIVWWPIEQAAAVLMQLYANRDMVKQAIYEITGISDIVRGQSHPNETLGAQNIKTKWGALRVQKMQRMVQRTVRDVFQICTEILSMHFTRETLTSISGVEVTDEMAELLDNPITRNYRVDVESDSTIQADMSDARNEMTNFLHGSANFFASMAPIVEGSPGAAALIAEIYGSFTRYFKLGKRAEESLAQLTEQLRKQAASPDKDKPSPAEQAMMADIKLKTDTLEQKSQSERMKHLRESYEIVRRAKLDENNLRKDLLALKIQSATAGKKLQVEVTDLERKTVKDLDDLELKHAELEIEQTQKRAAKIG